MTNIIAKTVYCPTCGSPPGRACKALNPEKNRIVPTHSARKALYDIHPRRAKPKTVFCRCGLHLKRHCEAGDCFETGTFPRGDNDFAGYRD